MENDTKNQDNLVKSTYGKVGNLALRRTTSITRRVYSLLTLIRLSIGRLVTKFFRYYYGVAVIKTVGYRNLYH